MKNKFIRKNIMNRFDETFILGAKVEILQPLPEHISLKKIKDIVESKLPIGFRHFLEEIFIGDFPELKEKQFQAIFQDGAIYLSSHPSQSKIDELRIAKDIIHELGHALEKTEEIQLKLYYDGALEKEFIAKRQTLKELLESEDIKVPKEIYNLEFSLEFDNFLYKTIGYSKLENFTIGLFTSPYSATSIEEYFANGVEEIYTGDINYLKEICPILYNKLEEIHRMVKKDGKLFNN